MKCFVMMPFAEDYDDVYQAIKRAGERAGGIDCFRLDDERPGGRILSRLFDALGDTDLCVADLSDNRPNVMWELGYAMARDQHPILLTRQGQSLPFDLHDMHQIPYDRSRLVQTLERPLADSLRDSVNLIQQRARGPSRLEQLEREVQRLHDIIGSGAAQLSSRSPGAPAGSGADLALPISRMVGAWRERLTGSRAYARLVGGNLAVVYCYEGNNELSGVYFDWRLQGEWIFGRYAWRKEPISGFSFLKAESDSLLVGSWWYDGDADQSVDLPPNPQSGWRAEWERVPDAPTPAWAEEGFGAIARLGIERLLASWRS